MRTDRSCWRVLGWLGCALAALLPVVAAAEPAGLLLGLRAAEPQPAARDPYRYRTLWLAAPDGPLRLAAEAAGVLLPRPAGFLRLGLRRSVYNAWKEDFLWLVAEPNERPWLPPAIRGIDPKLGEACSGEVRRVLHFVGPQHLGLAEENAGLCLGGAHPWARSTLAVRPLEPLLPREGAQAGAADAEETSLELGTLLGPAATEALQRGAAEHLARLEPQKRALLEAEPQAGSWSLVRRAGRWRVHGRLADVSGSAAAEVTDFEVPLAVPPELAGGAELTEAAWAEARRVVPEAADAFLSPGGERLVVLGGGRLRAFRMQGGRAADEPELQLELASDETAILVRWATAEQLQAWDEVLRKAAAAPPQFLQR